MTDTNAMELLYGGIKKKEQLTKILLDVNFDLKEDIKQLGGKWDADLKKWYVNNDNENIEEINIILKNYKPSPKNVVKNEKLYIYLPFKHKNEAKQKYDGLQFDKEKKKWFIYNNNINRDAIIKKYHSGNYNILTNSFII